MLLPSPDRGPDPHEGRRAAVGILDSGCGEHPWLTTVVRDHPNLVGTPVCPESALVRDPEVHPDQHGPLDGMLDAVSGHGTFIAGVVRQSAPTADVYSWRVVASDGAISESELVAALAHVADLVHANVDDPTAGLRLDVLSLSLGYYHESPEDPAHDAMLRPVLHALAADGVAIVCSAGNESTDRPLFPAAFAAVPSPGAPVLAVGARNPNGTVALFSNTGDWVSCYALGASVVSTSPPFEGGLQPLARIPETVDADGRLRECRETVDPDSYVGGFAVWSGTSFAAPHLAGLLATGLAAAHGELPRHTDTDKASATAAQVAAQLLDR
ncbi:hypothetical protein C8046_13440 [Serinibacter arcticus]|uniref:Peptidase S8/S53 domain-containing protein n=1 Tax=Serinibacter arcticus TaxID=1655435 RepID=A0A2U2A013_9MICO|nr:hypothetical protein C8046_13440 [Serinibacter arcticus]